MGATMTCDDKSSYVILSIFSVNFNRFYKQKRVVLEKLLMILGHCNVF